VVVVVIDVEVVVVVDDVPVVGNGVVVTTVVGNDVVVVTTVVGNDVVVVTTVVGNDVVVVTTVVVMLVSGFAGARITNFNSRERVTIKTAKMIKEMEIIQRRCRHLGRPLFPVKLSYAWLLCIMCFTRNFNLNEKKKLLF
jgi:hypothetical protein